MNEPISDEDRALIAYMKASGVPHVVTCTVNHSTNTTAGFPSRHRQPGTNGLGLAVDFAGPHGGSDTPEHLAIFHELEKQAHSLFELIYTPAGYAYKRGVKVPPYAAADHHNHVHASVDKGVLLVRPSPPIPVPVPQPVVVEYQETDVKTAFLTIPLGDAAHSFPGCGWTRWDPGFGRDPVPVGEPCQAGRRPEADNDYAEPQGKATARCAPENGKLIVTVSGGVPGDTWRGWVSAA